MFLLLAASVLADTPLRVATWNVESLGAPGSIGYEAALEVVLRLGADVLCFNEIGSNADASYLDSFVVDAGYNYHAVATGGPFGSDRSACISDYPLTAEEWTTADLSGEASASDLTRNFLAVTVDLPEGDDLVVISNHFKSGSSNTDEFRRAVEVQRAVQLFDQYRGLPTIFLGDLNADLGDGPGYPASFTELPSSLPSGWLLGPDLDVVLQDTGFLNDPFSLLGSVGTVLSATQADGSLTTRPSSGRRLDYIVVSPELEEVALAEVYNSELEGTEGLLSWIGGPLPPGSSLEAADHLPVVVDLWLAGTSNVAPVASISGAATGEAGRTLSLDGSASSDPDGSIVAWTWDFGDGSSGNGASVSHIWAAEGSFTVRLTVTDDQGASSSTSMSLQVTPANIAPVAAPGGPYAGSTRAGVRFSGLTSSDSDGRIVSYKWKFGDGSLGSGATPVHRYSRNGNYTVTLVVTDDDGASSYAVTTVRIGGR